MSTNVAGATGGPEVKVAYILMIDVRCTIRLSKSGEVGVTGGYKS